MLHDSEFLLDVLEFSTMFMSQATGGFQVLLLWQNLETTRVLWHTVLLVPSTRKKLYPLFFYRRKFIFTRSEIYEKIKFSISLGYWMREIFLMISHPAEAKKRSVISIYPFVAFYVLGSRFSRRNMEFKFLQSPAHRPMFEILSATPDCYAIF